MSRIKWYIDCLQNWISEFGPCDAIYNLETLKSLLRMRFVFNQFVTRKIDSRRATAILERCTNESTRLIKLLSEYPRVLM